MTSISFCIPCYNEEAYIGACIDAINTEMKHYDYPFEIIVVDNGSTDNTWLKAAKDNVRIVFEKEHRGIVWARKKGFEESRYELLAFVDADCRIPWGWLNVALLSFTDKDVVAVSGPERFYDTPAYVNFYAKQFYTVAKFLHNVYPTIQGGNYIVRREALEKIGGFDTDFEFYGEDTRTAIQLSKIGKVEMNPLMITETSGRRLMQQGLVNTVFTYVMNYFSTNMFNHPITKTHQDFR